MAKVRGLIKPEFETKVRYLKWVYSLCASTSFALGLWMVIAPTHFWGLIRVNDTDPIVQAIYGAAICGEGVLCLLGLFQPLRYIAIFQYMMAYKAIVCIALIPRLALMEDAPIAGWVIVFFWASTAMLCAWVFPWGKWKEVVARMRNE